MVSPFIADAYARVVFGFLRDSASRLDHAEPVYIVELGSGPGRFAYLCKALERVERALELDAEFDAAKALRVKLLSSPAR